MKKHILVLAMLVGGAGSAIAACPNNGPGYLNANAVISLLSNRTACSPANCTLAAGNCQWQEFHEGNGGGALIEQHSATAADPRETVGTWSVTNGTNNGTVTHTYSGGGSFPYRVHSNGATGYSFCGPNGEFTFTVKPTLGSNPC